jgi:membrane protein
LRPFRTLVELGRAFLQTYWRNEIPLRAAGISYFVFFSLIPIFAAAVSIAVVVPATRNAVEQALPHLARWLLPDAIHEVQDYFHAFASRASVVSLAGVAVAGWLLVKITFFVEQTLDRIWMAESSYSLFRLIKKVLLNGLLFVTLVVVGLALWSRGFSGTVFEWASACLLFLGFNRTLPDVPIGWRHAAPGALLGGTAWYVTKWGFTVYLQRLAKPDHIYAIFGILPLFFLWLHFTVVILLLSACLNSTLYHWRGKARREQPRPVSAASDRAGPSAVRT